MSRKRVIKSISFNPDDPFEAQLLAHVEQFAQFSIYIKRLIQRDKEIGPGVQNNIQTDIEVDDPNAMDSYF